MTLSKDVIVLGNWREKRRGEGEEHRGGERNGVEEGRKRRGDGRDGEGREEKGGKEEEGRWRARDSGHMSGDVERFSLFSQY